MALSEQQAEEVAQEKKRMSLAAGDSREKAERYAQEVRDYAAKDRAAAAGRLSLDDLTSSQRRLASAIDGYDGDLRDALIAQDAPAKDKAAVADFYGGRGAGDEFRREHIAKRSDCQHCGGRIVYFDGIRDPYWCHEDVSDHGGVPTAPRDSRTRLVFEQKSRR